MMAWPNFHPGNFFKKTLGVQPASQPASWKKVVTDWTPCRSGGGGGLAGLLGWVRMEPQKLANKKHTNPEGLKLFRQR